MKISEQVITKLKCSSCDLYLSVGPITSNSSSNIFCGRCPSGGVQVKIYEVLAANFDFPCRYQAFGCSETAKWGRVQIHEQNCVKKPHLCPAVPQSVCTWRGAVRDITKHFEDAHAEDITDDNLIELKLHENVEVCKLIKRNKECYFLHVFSNREQKLLKLNITQLIDIKSFKVRKYELKLHSHDSSKQIALAANPLKPHDSTDHNNIEDENVIDMSVLKFLTNDNPSIFCEISFNTEKNKRNSELLKLLDCPVCSDYMRSPVYQCQTGHSFCNLCITKLTDCPLCHKELTQTRNYALEELINQISHYCKNKDLFGCSYNGLFEDVKKHEETCDLYKCPLQLSQNCTWVGNFYNLIIHCKNNHIYLQTENYGLLCSLTTNKCAMFRLIHSDDMFFKICRKYENEEFCVVVQFVGPRNKGSDYSYEFSFVAIGNNKTMLSIQDECQVLTDNEKAFDNCFKIPYSVLSSFVRNNKLKFNVRIIKKSHNALTV